MITEISAALGSLKATSDIIKGLNAALTETKLNEVKLELQRALLDATQALAGAQASEAIADARIRELEQQIVQMKDWSAEKDSYQLNDIGRGVFAYVPKPGMKRDEPAHWLCAKCFKHNTKSILQLKGQDYKSNGAKLDTSTWACDDCHSAFKINYTVRPSYQLTAVENAARAIE